MASAQAATHTAREGFRVPRSRAFRTHEELREPLLAALGPVLFADNNEAAGQRAREQFEMAFAAEVGQSWAVGVHSGTAGLFLALRACGIGPGDEVITVANSDISTTAAISNCGATPVPCDVRASDHCMDPDLVESLITPRTRALLPVDLHGHPADVRRLRAIADRHALRIVEDAALATGARDHGRPVGAWADAAVFSFAPFKPLGSAGNGAAIVTSDEEVHRQLRLLVGYGYGRSDSWTPALPGHQYCIGEGYNLPLDGLQAALLLVKLPQLGEWTRQRRAIAARYRAGLAACGVTLPQFRPESEPTFRSFSIGLDCQAEALRRLRAAGIEAVLHYAPPAHHHEVYRAGMPNAGNLPVTERLARRLLNLPVAPGLTREEVDYVIQEVRALPAVRGRAGRKVFLS